MDLRGPKEYIATTSLSKSSSDEICESSESSSTGRDSRLLISKDYSEPIYGDPKLPTPVADDCAAGNPGIMAA